MSAERDRAEPDRFVTGAQPGPGGVTGAPASVTSDHATGGRVPVVAASAGDPDSVESRAGRPKVAGLVADSAPPGAHGGAEPLGGLGGTVPPGAHGGTPPGSPAGPEPQGAHGGPVPQGAAAGGTPSDPRVEDALSRLTELDGMPLAEQVAVFADIHRRLDGVLADPESRG